MISVAIWQLPVTILNIMWVIVRSCQCSKAIQWLAENLHAHTSGILCPPPLVLKYKSDHSENA